MIQNYTLVRDVLSSAPDGNSVRITQTVDVEIRCSGGLPKSGPEGYAVAGEWRVLESKEPNE